MPHLLMDIMQVLLAYGNSVIRAIIPCEYSDFNFAYQIPLTTYTLRLSLCKEPLLSDVKVAIKVTRLVFMMLI